jgi:hypothetical protein
MVEEEFADNPPALKALRAYFKNTAPPTYAPSTLTAALNAALKAKDTSIGKLVSNWYKEGAITGMTLEQSLLDESGLTGKDAQILVGAIADRFRTLREEYARDFITKFLKAPKTPKRNKHATKMRVEKILAADTMLKDMFTDRVLRALHPTVQGLIRESGIDLATVVRLGYDATAEAKANMVAYIKQFAIPNDAIGGLIDMATEQFDKLAEEQRVRILSKMMGQPRKPTMAGYITKLDELGRLNVYSQGTINDAIREHYALPLLGASDVIFISTNMEVYRRETDVNKRAAIYRAVMDRVIDVIAQSMEITNWDKFTGYRYFAMLASVPTHMRNFGGNGIHLMQLMLANRLATSIMDLQIMTGKRLPEDRMRSYAPRSTEYDKMSAADKKAWRQTVADAVDKARVIDTYEGKGNSRYIAGKEATGSSLTQRARQARTIFNKGVPTRIVEAVTGKKMKYGLLEYGRRGSMEVLEIEDDIFWNIAYRQRLTTFMNAKGLKTPTIEGRKLAVEAANIATFKAQNQISEALNKMKKIPGFGLVVDVVVPFTKTPSNILGISIDYSIFGFIKAAMHMHQAKKVVGSYSADDIILQFSKAFVGTSISVLGFVLALLGLVRTGSDDDEPSRQALALEGMQSNSIYIKGVGSYTLDWVQPASMAFFFAVQVAEGIKRATDNETPFGLGMLSIAGQSMIDAADTVFQTSMFRGVASMFSAGGFTAGVFKAIIADLPLQMIPSMSGRVAMMIDPIVRNTKGRNLIETALLKGAAKLPGVSFLVPEKIDILGEAIRRQDGFLLRFIESFVSPGFISTDRGDPVSEELVRVYLETGNKAMMPNLINPKHDSKRTGAFVLSPSEVSYYQAISGKKSHARLEAIFGSETYPNQTDDQRAARILKATTDVSDDINALILNDYYKKTR